MLSQSQCGMSRMQASMISSRASVMVSSDCSGSRSRSDCECECECEAVEGASDVLVPPLDDSVHGPYECSEYLHNKHY